MGEWISVKEEMPQEHKESNDIYDPDTLAVVDCEHHNVSDLVIVAVLCNSGETILADDITVDGEWVNFPFPEWEVTHWMPFPAPPKED